MMFFRQKIRMMPTDCCYSLLIRRFDGHSLNSRRLPPFQLISSEFSYRNSPAKRHLASKHVQTYPFISITSPTDAQSLVSRLTTSERDMLLTALNERVKANDSASGGAAVAALTSEHRKALFLSSLLPFIGFGILDNLLMIVAGEYIDNTLGVILGISTMAAAGLGNILSDIAGVGSAHYVEMVVDKMFGIKAPSLTPDQWTSPSVRRTSNLARCVGLVIGCLIGMSPLIFFDEQEKQEKKLAEKKLAAK